MNTKYSAFMFGAVSVICVGAEERGRVYEVFASKFREDITRLEVSTYELFKGKPLVHGNYLAVPWRRFKSDAHYAALARSLAGNNFSRSCTVCFYFQSHHALKTVEVAKIANVECIFTPCAVNGIEEINGVRIKPFPYYAVVGTPPAEHKDIFYSFIGCQTHVVRDKIFRMKHPSNTVIKKRPGGWALPASIRTYWDEEYVSMRSEWAAEYRNVLSRSRFSLCPRGNEPGSIRFYESLQAGAIPILLADTWRLPEGPDWNSCIIRVPERNVERIPEILAAVTPQQEEKMRAACLKAYEMFSGDNLVGVIRRHYGE